MTSSTGATVIHRHLDVRFGASFREFELMVLNGSWVDALACQLTPETCCDLTFDLGSDSDYNLRVRAGCGSQKSTWTKTSSPFNRRDSENKRSRRG